MFFPITKKKIYFDSARSGGLSSELSKWRKNHEKLFLKEGSLFRDDNNKLIEEVRKGVSKFIGSVNNYTFLTPSFSLGFQSLLSFLDPKLNFLVLKEDYPSIINGLKLNNFNYEVLENSFDIEQKIIAVIKKSPIDVLVVSIVQYTNGVFLSIDFFKKLKNLYPDLLIIADGTQFCGTRSFDFDESKIDVMISSGYKWVFGGYGNGFVLIRETLKRFIAKNKIQKFNSSILKNIFEPGNLDTLNFGSLLFSINLISKYGLDKIEKKISSLSKYAKQQFLKNDLLDNIAKKRTNHSNIFCIKGDKNLYIKLLNKGIICSMRGSGIRVSFSFFNTKKQINELLKFF